MSAVTVNASARPAAKVTGRSTMFAKRCETRKLAAQAATRSVQARAITEVTAESTDANSALYEEFKKLLVDYEFAYKVGDRVSGKVFHCDAKGAWVDIGAKAAALCPSAEASLADVRNVRPPPRSDAIPTAPASSPSRAAPRGLPPVARASAASRATAFERAHFLTRAPTRVRPNAREWINDKRERRRDVSPPASRPTVTLTRPIPPPRHLPSRRRRLRCSTSARSTSSRSSATTTATGPSPSPCARFRCVSGRLFHARRARKSDPNYPRPSNHGPQFVSFAGDAAAFADPAARPFRRIDPKKP